MKVRLSFSVDIDPDAWATEFSLGDASSREIRDDVRVYFEGLCDAQIETLQVGAPAAGSFPEPDGQRIDGAGRIVSTSR